MVPLPPSERTGGSSRSTASRSGSTALAESTRASSSRAPLTQRSGARPSFGHASTRTEASAATIARRRVGTRSEEHTSELQSLMRISYAVFCLKKTISKIQTDNISEHVVYLPTYRNAQQFSTDINTIITNININSHLSSTPLTY